MTHTVPCPECHRPAQVLDSFTLQRSTGPVRFLRVQCDGSLAFLVNAEEMGSASQPPQTDPVEPVDETALHPAAPPPWPSDSEANTATTP
jgi:hypothetical protein